MARRDAGAVATELRKACTAPSAEAALDRLAEFSAGERGQKYPQAVRVFEDAWDDFTHFPTDDSVVKLLWLAIINIEDKRAGERLARRAETGKRSDRPAKLVEGQRVIGWRDASTSSTPPTRDDSG